MAAVASAGQAVGGLIQGAVGLVQKGKAKRLARANKRPTYNIQQPILDNQAIAESRAGQGISDATRQTLEQGSQRGLTNSIDAILGGGGSVNNIGDLYGNYQDGISKMALIDEEMRTKNVKNLIDQNTTLAGEQDKAWQVNVFAPYADKAQAAAALSKQGSDNIWKGANSVIGAGASFATSKLYNNEKNNVYGTGGNVGNDGANNGFSVNPNGSTTPYNWQNSNTATPPARPSATQQANQAVQQSYPGLMMGNMNGGYDMTLFNEAVN